MAGSKPKIPRFLKALRPEEDACVDLIDNGGGERCIFMQSGFGMGQGTYESAGTEHGGDMPRDFEDDRFLHYWEYYPYIPDSRESETGEGVCTS